MHTQTTFVRFTRYKTVFIPALPISDLKALTKIVLALTEIVLALTEIVLALTEILLALTTSHLHAR